VLQTCYKIFVEHEHTHSSTKTKITFFFRPPEKEKMTPGSRERYQKFKISYLPYPTPPSEGQFSHPLSHQAAGFLFMLFLFPFGDFLGVLSVDGLLV